MSFGFKIMSGASGKVVVTEKRAKKFFKSEKDYWNEVNIFAEVGWHPHVVTISDFSPKNLLVEMEYASCGNLLEKHIIDGINSVEEARSITQQVACAVHHLHSFNIIHMDIKPENILCFPNGVFKISDFGFSIKGTPTTYGTGIYTNARGTALYMAPELEAAGGMVNYFYSAEKLDVYSLAVTYFYILTGGCYPFYNVLDVMEFTEYRELFRTKVLDRVPSITADVMQSLEAGLERNPVRRTQSVLYLASGSFE